MAMSDYMDTSIWTSDDNQNMFHRFEWSAVRSGYTSTVSYKVTIRGTDTDEWVRQNIESLIVTANGSTKVNSYTNWAGYYIYSDRPANTTNTVLLSGSFTVDHSYEDGSASFAVQLVSDFWYSRNTPQGTETQGQYSASKTFNLDPISVGNPSVKSIKDNGNNTITVEYEYGQNLTGGTGYLYISVDSGVSESKYGYSKQITKSSDTTKKITVSLDDISNIIKSAIKNTNSLFAKFYQYNSSILKGSSAKSDSAIYYKEPGAPSGITYKTNNKYGKYTVTSSIEFNWSAPSSGCDGYKIRVIVNGSAIKINGNNTYLDRDGGINTSYTVDCSSLGLKAGDIVKLGLYAYVKRGDSAQLCNGSGTTANQIYSSEITIVPDKNFIAHAKINGQWKKVNLIHAKMLDASFKEVQNINN